MFCYGLTMASSPGDKTHPVKEALHLGIPSLRLLIQILIPRDLVDIMLLVLWFASVNQSDDGATSQKKIPGTGECLWGRLGDGSQKRNLLFPALTQLLCLPNSRYPHPLTGICGNRLVRPRFFAGSFLVGRCVKGTPKCPYSFLSGL